MSTKDKNKLTELQLDVMYDCVEADDTEEYFLNVTTPNAKALLEHEECLSAMGYFCLAQFYGDSEYPSSYNKNKAREYYLQAAKQGHATSILCLYHHNLVPNDIALCWIKVLVIDDPNSGVVKEAYQDLSYGVSTEQLDIIEIDAQKTFNNIIDAGYKIHDFC